MGNRDHDDPGWRPYSERHAPSFDRERPRGHHHRGDLRRQEGRAVRAARRLLVFEHLVGLVRDTRLAAVVATHNLNLAARMDRTLALEGGKVVAR